MQYLSKNSLILSLAIILFLFHSGYLYNFTVDDAYISFRYADNLAQGQGMVFNPGEREEGYSNFLWIILLGIFSWGGMSPLISSKVLSGMFGAGIFFLTYHLSGICGRKNSSPGFAALFLIAANTSLVLWAASGMETTFYTFLLLLASYLFLRECEGKGRYLSAFCFFLLALTRPEGILFFVLPVFFRIYDLLNPDSNFNRRSFCIYILLFSLPFSAYLLWKYLYFGSIIPNPFYAKFNAPLRLIYEPASKLRKAWTYLTRAIIQNNLVVTIPFLGVLFGSIGKEKRKLFFMAGIILVQILFIVSVGGDWMPYYRFVVPILPFIYLLFQEGIKSSTVTIKNRLFKFSLVVTVFMLCMINFPYSRMEHREYLRQSKGDLKRIKEFGVWLRQTFPPHYTVAYEEAGIPMYYSRLRLLDTLGLLNRDIGKVWYSLPRDYWEVNKRVVDYVLEKQPELIVLVSKRNPKELRDFYGGTDYTFFYSKRFQMNYELIQTKDWVLPRERELWPDGLSLLVYLRKDLKPLHRGLT